MHKFLAEQAWELCRIKNGSKRKYRSKGGDNTCISTYVISRAFSLTKSCSNNVVEYNALLIGMQLAEEISVKYLEAHGEAKLIISQV